MTDPLIALWAAQPALTAPIDQQALTRRERQLRRRTQMRDVIEFGAAALAVAVFIWSAFRTDDMLVRIAHGLIIAGMAIVCRNLWLRRMRTPDADVGMAGVAYLRAQLVRQREALADVARWYLGPLVPGLALLYATIGWRMIQTERAAEAAATLAPLVIATIGVFGAILWLNRRAADRLTVEIDTLDREIGDGEG